MWDLRAERGILQTKICFMFFISVLILENSPVFVQTNSMDIHGYAETEFRAVWCFWDSGIGFELPAVLGCIAKSHNAFFGGIWVFAVLLNGLQH